MAEAIWNQRKERSPLSASILKTIDKKNEVVHYAFIQRSRKDDSGNWINNSIIFFTVDEALEMAENLDELIKEFRKYSKKQEKAKLPSAS